MPLSRSGHLSASWWVYRSWHGVIKNGKAHDPAQHRVGVLVDGREQHRLLATGKAPISPLSGTRLSDVGDRVEGQTDMPFLDRYVERVAE